MISVESVMHPSHDFFRTGCGGTTSAIGRPDRVMRTGVPVFRTSSSTSTHVALNLEIAISRMLNSYHAHNNGPIARYVRRLL